MTSEKFVEDVRATIVDDNIAAYRSIFSARDSALVRDPHWRDALEFFQALREGDREIFFTILRQVALDSVSNLFGILDGSSQLRGKFEDFVLTHKETGVQLNGELQDLLLSE